MPDAEPDSLDASTRTAQIGSYRLLEQLGSGGMSSVFRAVHVESDHEVALKVLPRTLAKASTMLQRFLREAKSAESLDHPNIVAIYDRGQEQGRYYLVLEYVAGGDLHDLVRAKGPLTVAKAIEVIQQVARGLSYAATRGVIHRDIKPSNILLTNDGRAKIADLGLALSAEDEDERVTRDGTTVGTVDYMSPEQARHSRATSIKSDIYSLGCTFYHILTAQPPFPGGSVIEKLRRHAQEPAPDVRALRPDVPEALARILQRMLAKKPDQRFTSYEELIAALSAVPLGPAAYLPPPPPGQPLEALIDDEDGDFLPLDQPALPVSTTEAKPVSAPSGPLYALIDDEGPPPSAEPRRGSSSGLRTGPTPSGSQIDARRASGARPAPASAPPSRDGINLADLASLDDAPAASDRRRGPPPSPSAPAAEAILDDEDDEDLGAGPRRPLPFAPRPSADVDVRQMVTRGLLIGAAVVLVIIGVHQLIRIQNQPVKPPADTSATESFEPEPEPEIPPAPVRRPTPKRPDATGKLADATGATTAADPGAAAASTAWREEPPPPPIPEETPLPGNLEAASRPEWAATGPALERKVTVVRRLAGPGEAPSLVRALEAAGGTTEIADDGPFFERNLPLGSRPRHIRARPGYRPVIVLEPPSGELALSQPAMYAIKGAVDLLLEGLDLVVPVERMPALFSIQAGTLTLRDCTVTVVGPSSQAFTLARLGEGSGAVDARRPPRLHLERTLVRGPAVTVADFGPAPGEAFLDRSALLCGDAPTFDASRAGGPGARRLTLLRTVVAARRPVIEFAAVPDALAVRAAGSTFARIYGAAQQQSLLASRDDLTGAPSTALDWSGDANAFLGWTGWLRTGPNRTVRLDALDDARKAWPGQDAQSREDPSTTWPEKFAQGESDPLDLEPLAPDRLATLRRLPRPDGSLLERTVRPFPMIPLPPLVEPSLPPPTAVAGPAPPPAAAKVGSPTSGGMKRRLADGDLSGSGHPGIVGPPPSAAPANAAGPPAAGPVLAFNVAEPPWNGDLGRFLAEKLAEKDVPTHLAVRVRGQGQFALTPVSVPPGVSLTIQVETPGAVVWTVAPGPSDAEAALDVRNADLTLIDVRLTRDGGDRPRHLVRVDGGNLHIFRGRLLAPEEVSAEGGGLIFFRADDGRHLRPLPPGAVAAWPAARLVNTVLITGGVALTAEVSGGAVTLDNCQVAGLEAAFDLRPGKIPHTAFMADLSLRRCTVAGARVLVRLGPWPGAASGPDRPWLVNTQSCAFLDVMRIASTRRAALLETDPEAFARGTLFWQASGDAYELALFAAPGPGREGIANRRTDIDREWIDLWGDIHVRNVTGPGGSRTSGIKFQGDRLRPGQVTPENLLLDSTSGGPGRSRKPPNVGADPLPLGLAAPAGRT